MPPTDVVDTSAALNRLDRSLLGQVIAERYRVERLLARGGMGRVYLGQQLNLDRRVVLKVLLGSPDEDARPAHLRRFLREAATCARLEHPNTVTVFDYGELDLPASGLHFYYLVMEHIPGVSLDVVLRQEGALDVERTLRIVWEIGRALREAHRKGVIHRDLKPANVMVYQNAEGEAVKVLDFGIAKVLEEPEGEQPITLDNRIVGSPRYMAPELILENVASPASDIYALGVLMYELLCGEAPFALSGATQTMMAQIHQPVPPLASRGVVLPEDVEAILMRCLAKDPGQRYPDVPALFQDLRALLLLEDGVTVETTLWTLRTAPLAPAPPLPSPPVPPAPGPALVGGEASPGGSRTLLFLVVLLNVAVFGWLLASYWRP